MNQVGNPQYKTYSPDKVDLIAALSKAEKGLMERVARMVLGTPNLLDDLVDICASNEKVVSWRAAWVLNHLARKNKDFIRPVVPRFIEFFTALKYDGQKACLLKCMSRFNLEFEEMGIILDECLLFIQKEVTRPYIISYAMDFLLKMCKQEPELAREVSLVIDTSKGHFPSTYLKNKAQKVQSELRNLDLQQLNR